MSKASVQRTTRSKEKHGSTHEYSIQAVVTLCKWKGQTDAMLRCLPGCLTTLHGLRRKQIKCRIAPSIYGRVSYSIATYSDIPQPLRPVICSCWVRVQSASMKLRANIYHERNHPKPTQCTRLSLNFCFSITLNQQSYYRRQNISSQLFNGHSLPNSRSRTLHATRATPQATLKQFRSVIRSETLIWGKP